MRSRPLVIGLLAAALIVGQATAADWWTLTGSTDQCPPAKQSPLQSEQFWLSKGLDVSITNKGDEVDILEAGGDYPLQVFFRSQAACQAAIPAERADEAAILATIKTEKGALHKDR